MHIRRIVDWIILSFVYSVLAGGATALGHPALAHVSNRGIEFIEAQAKTYVPEVMSVPPITKAMYSCPSGDATFTQRNTDVALDLHDLQISIPASGTLRVDLTLSAHADGEAYLEKPYACIGSTTCQDDLYVDHARAVIDFAAWVDEGGQLHAALDHVDLFLTPEQIEASFSDCAISGIVNTVIDLAKDYAVEMLLGKVDELAREKIGPMLEQMLQGFGGISKQIGPLIIEAGLTRLDLTTSGIDLDADVDMSSVGPLLEICPQEEGPGEPSPHQGPTPDLRDGPDTHVAVAVNLGLMDDVLYHVWSSGLICITPDILDIFNIDLDLTMVGDLLPGFPEGTRFRLMAYLLVPPTMSVAAGPGATMTMGMNGFIADLDAMLPDGSTRSLHVELDASATMSVGLDPYANALTMSLVDVSIERLAISEESSADMLGFDFSRMKQLLEERVLPHVAEEMTGIPLTGPIFGGLMGYYVILKEVRATGAYVVAKLDLFRAPETDLNAPDTRIEEAPQGLVAAKDAFIVVAGEDQEVPPDLLQFEVVANNRLYEPTFVRKIPVGKAGESGTYEVEVRALDLNGNMDPTPARVEVTVDGILPHVGITSAPGGSTEKTNPTITWEMSDDMTSASRLRPVLSLYRMPGSGDPDDTIELSPGQTSSPVELGSGSWRVVVTVYDEAGNEASDSQIFDAGKGGGCGCQTARRLPSNHAWALVLLGLGLAAIRIRRRVI